MQKKQKGFGDINQLCVDGYFFGKLGDSMKVVSNQT